MIRFENEDVTPMRFYEVVSEFIHKHLVAGVDRSFGDDLTAAVGPTRIHVECAFQDLGRCINQPVLVKANYSGKREEEEEFLLLHLQDLIVLGRDNVDVIAPAQNKFSDLLQQ